MQVSVYANIAHELTEDTPCGSIAVFFCVVKNFDFKSSTVTWTFLHITDT
jgi:hypothetical protein